MTDCKVRNYSTVFSSDTVKHISYFSRKPLVPFILFFFNYVNSGSWREYHVNYLQAKSLPKFCIGLGTTKHSFSVPPGNLFPFYPDKRTITLSKAHFWISTLGHSRFPVLNLEHPSDTRAESIMPSTSLIFSLSISLPRSLRGGKTKLIWLLNKDQWNIRKGKDRDAELKAAGEGKKFCLCASGRSLEYPCLWKTENLP